MGRVCSLNYLKVLTEAAVARLGVRGQSLRLGGPRGAGLRGSALGPRSLLPGTLPGEPGFASHLRPSPWAPLQLH